MQTPLPAFFAIRRSPAGPRDIPASPHPLAWRPAVYALPSCPPQDPAIAVLTPFVRRLLWLKGEPARPMRAVTALAGLIPRRALRTHPAPAFMPGPVYLILLFSLTPSPPLSRAY